MPHDLEAFERDCRAMMAKIEEMGEAQVADGTASASFTKAQAAYSETRIQFALAPVRLDNDGIEDEDIACAAGIALGAMYANMVMTYRNRPDLQEALDQWVAKATHDFLAGSIPEDEGTEFMMTYTVKKAPN